MPNLMLALIKKDFLNAETPKDKESEELLIIQSIIREAVKETFGKPLVVLSPLALQQSANAGCYPLELVIQSSDGKKHGFDWKENAQDLSGKLIILLRQKLVEGGYEKFKDINTIAVSYDPNLIVAEG